MGLKERHLFTKVPDFCLSLCQCQDGRPLSSRDRHNLQELESKLQVLQRRGRHLEIAERNCCTKVGSALRPFKVSIYYVYVAIHVHCGYYTLESYTYCL